MAEGRAALQPPVTSPFTGKGTPNPQKLFIPRKHEFDPAQLAAFLAIENWINSSQESAAGFAEISQTYSVSGTLSVPSGGTGYLPPFFMPVAPGQTMALGAVRYMVRAGSATMNIQHNGSNIATGINVTTSAASTTVLASVANNDTFAPVLTAVSSADGLTCSFYFEVSS